MSSWHQLQLSLLLSENKWINLSQRCICINKEFIQPLNYNCSITYMFDIVKQFKGCFTCKIIRDANQGVNCKFMDLLRSIFSYLLNIHSTLLAKHQNSRF